MLSITVKAEVKPGMHETLREVIDVFQNQYGESEPGCEMYRCYVDGDQLVFTELWQDQAALDQHMQTEHAIKYVPVLKSCVVNGELHVQAIVSDEVHHSIV
ncbi:MULTISPECIES: putative quinol monooxygenase [Marinobacterium]|nr:MULTISPECIES: antibiotic biosynthesis monooxygenase [Marinobacterium]TCK08993.1 quinol monooxygenase YgiN [Marinobacterium mangrovicola]